MAWNPQKDKLLVNNKHRAGAMRKTILRNPELPLEDFPLLPDIEMNSRPKSSNRSVEDQENNNPSSSHYHQPKLNSANEARQKLAEITQYREKTLESLSDLTIGTRKALNKEISSKLNFKPNQIIFKNLIPLEDTPKKPKQVNDLIEKSKHRIINPHKTKAAEVREDIYTLIDGLIALDYKDAFIELKNPTHISFQAEADYLGFSKFTTNRFHLPKKDAITGRYSDQVRAETEELFRDENYLNGPNWSLLDAPKAKVENQCPCLKEYSNFPNCV